MNIQVAVAVGEGRAVISICDTHEKSFVCQCGGRRSAGDHEQWPMPMPVWERVYEIFRRVVGEKIRQDFLTNNPWLRFHYGLYRQDDLFVSATFELSTAGAKILR